MVTASIAGPILRLPGGDLSFALGYEHRNERQASTLAPSYAAAAIPIRRPTRTATAIRPTTGSSSAGRCRSCRSAASYNTDELFGELTAELVRPTNDIPFIYQLELHGAARYVEHSTAGGDTTYTVEGRFAPIRDIAFRGNYTHAIRAPAITESFNPSSSFFGFATDPCDATQRGNGPAPATRQANCTAAGVPANFTSLSDQRSFSQERWRAMSAEQREVERLVGGRDRHAALHPVASHLGRLSRHQAAQRDQPAGSEPGRGELLRLSDFPNNDFCQRVTRDPTDSQLNFVQTSFFNSSELRYKGILVALDYRLGTPFLGTGSHLGFNLQYQYLDTLTEQADATASLAISTARSAIRIIPRC